MSGRVVDLAVKMKPTTFAKAGWMEKIPGVDATEHRSIVDRGELSLKVMEAPPNQGLAPGTHLFAILETWPNGHEEMLVCGHGPSLTAAFANAAPHFEQITRARNA